MKKPKIVCYCGSLRVALDAFKKAEYEAVLKGEIALLPCCMFVDIQREYGAESDYKLKADDLHKRKIDICDEVFVLNVNGYIGDSTRSEIDYALSIEKTVRYLDPESFFKSA
jgi:poly(A) polymerase Pap1